MKKVFLIATVILTTALVSCNAKVDTSEDAGVGANKAVEGMEALAGADKDSTLACTCEHACKTKEECVEKCGEGCGMLKE
jgi:hypothetical protein